MSSRRVAALVFALLACSGVAAGCERVRVLDAVWPEAVSERTVPRPPGPPRWPLTGMPAPDAKATRGRIVSIKIENSPQARPQYGLDKADLVYETVTEGGITRFNALFHSRLPRKLAPVRSARASDLYVVPQYKAIFGHIGGDTLVRDRLANRRKYADMDQFFNPAPYWRGRDRRAPHNVYVDVVKLRDQAIKKRRYAATADVRGFPFDRTVGVATPTIRAITVPFSKSNKVKWTYNPRGRTYARSINGKSHKDKASGKQYTARNVVVIWAQMKVWRKRDVAGNPVYNIVLEGSGRAAVFRNGQRYNGRWTAGTSAPPTFKSDDGAILRLSPGNTWFQVIANDQNITLK